MFPIAEATSALERDVGSTAVKHPPKEERKRNLSAKPTAATCEHAKIVELPSGEKVEQLKTPEGQYKKHLDDIQKGKRI